MGPCPTPPTITGAPSSEPGWSGDEDADWFDNTARIVDTYAEQLVGFDETAAQTCVEDAGLIWRVVARDGEYFGVTADYSPQRINAVIEDAIVMEITVG